MDKPPPLIGVFTNVEKYTREQALRGRNIRGSFVLRGRACFLKQMM